jgi:pimeloyl-CoA dehydrogenase small subunit
MDFELSEEQAMLEESVSRFLADRYSFEQRRKFIAHEQGFDPAIWASYAELGLLGLPFAAEDGGIGGGPVETMIVMQQMGRALTVEPYLSTVVIASAVLAAASAAQRARLVPEIAAGTRKLAFAHTEREARYVPSHVATRARKAGGGWRLDGAKSLVLHGGVADALIVSARVDGADRDEKGVALFLVEAGAKGVARQSYPTQDGMRAAEITFTDVDVDAADVIGTAGDAMPVIRKAIDVATAAVCAEAVGVMQQALDMTVEYLKTRKQFGRPIGQFQVLQHKAAEMLIEVEQSRSMAMYAAMMSQSDDAKEREPAISAAKVRIGTATRLLGQAAVQLHGGIGMTMEYGVGHHFKRLTMIEKAFGDTSFHLDRLDALAA